MLDRIHRRPVRHRAHIRIAQAGYGYAEAITRRAMGDHGGRIGGGIQALSTVLGALPRDLPAAIVVVQHRVPSSHPNSFRAPRSRIHSAHAARQRLCVSQERGGMVGSAVGADSGAGDAGAHRPGTRDDHGPPEDAAQLTPRRAHSDRPSRTAGHSPAPGERLPDRISWRTL